MTYSSIGFLAFFINLIINYDILKKSRVEKIEIPGKKNYKRFLFGVSLYYITDVLWGFFYEHGLISLAYIDTFFYFVAMAVSVFFWVRYVADYIGITGKNYKLFISVGYLFFFLEFLILIINIFKPIMFWFDENGGYHTNVLRTWTLAVQVVMFLAVSLNLIFRSGKMEGKTGFRCRAIAISGVVMALFIALQAYEPLLPYYAVGCILSTCIIYTFIVEDEKQDYITELEELINLQKMHTKELGEAKYKAYTDSLTGVKNHMAYIEATEKLEEDIKNGEMPEFGVIVFDLNGLKIINDTKGHEAGDLYIQSAAGLICRRFKKSPVYRIGGDEFVVILKGEDYKDREKLLDEFNSQIDINVKRKGVVIASGMERYNPLVFTGYKSVFESADKKMYRRKKALKEVAV
ncbi:MAG: GGDEF domain-containing protein [Lachnospiraceae bacterium]|nr:GGDEF domain-containing protein [Lachnospiraceae bacterium]